MTVTTPTTSTTHVAPTSDGVRTPEWHRLGRINRRLALVLGASIAAVAVALSLLLVVDQAPGVSAADAASTARLDGAAAQYDAIRQARSNQAWTTRLEAAAAQHDAARRARALEADAARLTQQAGLARD